MPALNTNALMSEVAARLGEFGLTSSTGPDGLHVTGPGADQQRIVVRARASNNPVLPATVQQWRDASPGEVVMLAQPHISARQSARYRAMGLPHIDASGNAWLVDPPVIIAVEGRPPIERPASAGQEAFTPTGLRVIFALLVAPTLADATVRQVSAASGASLGAAQKSLSQLRAGRHLAKGRTGWHIVTPGTLAQRWIQGYVTRMHDRLESSFVDGPEPTWWTPEHLDPAWGVALGGEPGLRALGVGLRPASTTLYGAPPWRGVRQGARLAPAQREGSIELRERFWDPDALGVGWTVVPDLLVYADAITSTSPRVHEAAAQLWEASDALRPFR